MKELIVVKFGGSVLREGSDFTAAAEHVRELVSGGSWVVVVVSAMKGVTDELLGLVERPGRTSVVEKLLAKHLEALEAAAGGEVRKDGAEELRRLGEELTKVAWAVEVVGEVTPRLRDFIVSFGERLSAVIMASALRSVGLESVWLTGWDAGIVTDDAFGEANPLHEVSSKLVRGRLRPLINRGIVPVITGFIAGTLDGTTTVLGRGGSDYTATLLARYLGAKEVRLFTDVPGIMSADPALVPEARIIPELSFREAMELAYLGAKRFHPRTFEPLWGSDVAVRITSMKGGGGTLVTEVGGGPPLKAVVIIDDLSVVSVEGAGMVGRLGTAAEVMSTAAKNSVNIAGILQPLSEVSISLIVRRNDSVRLSRGLMGLVDRGVVREVRTTGGVIAACVVGEGVRDPRVAARLVEKAARGDLRMILWCGGVSVMFVYESSDARGIARLLHDEVVSSEG